MLHSVMRVLTENSSPCRTQAGPRMLLSTSHSQSPLRTLPRMSNPRLAKMCVLIEGDDQRYLEWLEEHPTGFVLNILRRHHDPSYVVLHRAGCFVIGPSFRSLEPGAFTARKYRKVCGETIDALRAWARNYGREDGSFSKTCALCRPEAPAGPDLRKRQPWRQP